MGKGLHSKALPDPMALVALLVGVSSHPLRDKLLQGLPFLGILSRQKVVDDLVYHLLLIIVLPSDEMLSVNPVENYPLDRRRDAGFPEVD